MQHKPNSPAAPSERRLGRVSSSVCHFAGAWLQASPTGVRQCTYRRRLAHTLSEDRSKGN